MKDNKNNFRLCTYRYGGFTSVGIGLGEEPDEIIDVERAFTFMHKELDNRKFLLWPTKLDMLQIMKNWDYFNDRLHELVSSVIKGEVPNAQECDFVYKTSDVSFTAPIPNPGKTLNAGGNYYDHMEEMGVIGKDTVETELDIPFIFVTTPSNTLIGEGDTIILPEERHWKRPNNDVLTWETELAVVVGRTAKDVSPEEALDYVAGYTIYQDVSAEAVTIRGAFEMDWFNSKSGDTFAPTGPWIVPEEFIEDPQNLKLKTTVNGKIQQDSNTNQMMYSVAEMVSYASSISQLEPGDILTTGTCAGNGFAKNMDKLDPEKVMAEAPEGLHYGSAMLLANVAAGNAEWLKDGDILVTEVEGIGKLTNPVSVDKKKKKQYKTRGIRW